MTTDQLYTREAPYLAEVLERTPEGHCFSLRLSIDPEIGYVPGDSVGILPKNDPERLSQTAALLNCPPELLEAKSIQHVTGKFLRFVRPFAKNLEEIDLLIREGRITDRFIPLWEILESCESVPAQECLDNLSPLLPRFYSIASANAQNAIDLLISKTEMPSWRGEVLPGLCTDYLEMRAEIGTPNVPLYLHRAEHFRLPEDPHADIIMIGPGTGVAPFRAFLHARAELPGRNWLFFGARHEASDFYFEQEFRALESAGRLKLTTAFSRDADRKVYVQHRIREEADALWQWLNGGAYLYICGDAKRMAREVVEVLSQIACERGRPNFFKELKASCRMALDVY